MWIFKRVVLSNCVQWLNICVAVEYYIYCIIVAKLVNFAKGCSNNRECLWISGATQYRLQRAPYSIYWTYNTCSSFHLSYNCVLSASQIGAVHTKSCGLEIPPNSHYSLIYHLYGIKDTNSWSPFIFSKNFQRFLEMFFFSSKYS